MVNDCDQWPDPDSSGYMETVPDRTVTDIEYLIFDLGHVLVDVAFEHGDLALARLVNRHRPSVAGACAPDTEFAARAVEDFRSQSIYQGFMTGKLDPESFRRAFCESAGIPSEAVKEAEFKAAWMEYLIGPQAGMGELLDRLARDHGEGAGPGLAILSNTDIWHWEACESLVPGIGHVRPSHRFASCNLGLAKPDPAIYLEVARRLAVAPGRCVMIDDLQRNLEGARASGMRAILFQNAGKLGTRLGDLGLI